MQEFVRKLIHLILGVLVAAMVHIAGQAAAIAILAGGLLIGVVLVDILLRGHNIPLFSFLVGHFDRNDRLPGRGALTFAVSALAVVVLFPVTISVPAIVTLAVLDSVTTIAGLRFGKHRIYNGKSWEGTLSGIAVTAIVLLPLLTPAGAAAVAVLAGIIELISPVDDNLVIPVAVAVLLAFVPAFHSFAA
jgi:dolichol kinase